MWLNEVARWLLWPTKQINDSLPNVNAAIADEQRNVALLNQYHAEIVSGHTDWERGNLGRLNRKLLGHLPLAGQHDRRGWEWYYLLALSHPERQTLFFPGLSPFAAWSPDGEYIASSGSIWRAESGENIRRIKPSRIRRYDGAWSADGNGMPGQPRPKTVVFTYGTVRPTKSVSYEDIKKASGRSAGVRTANRLHPEEWTLGFGFGKSLPGQP